MEAQRLAHYQALESEARNDHPYTFGQTITTARPGPFSTRQLARLMILKSKIAERGCWS